MTTPQQLYDAYYRNPDHEMHPYMPFLRQNARGNILEIGVRDGVSTAAFLCGLEKNGGHLFSVDINPECGKVFEGHPQWTFVCADSRNTAKVYVDIHSQTWEGVEILLIDGNHSREIVRNDITMYAATLKKSGGFLLVHDIYGTPGGATPEQIADNWPTEAVGEEFYAFARKMGWPTLELPGPFGMGVMVRI